MISQREIFIALVDSDNYKKSDAIILLEGDGFFRLEKAVDLYELGFAPLIVFSGGITNYSYGSFPFEDIFPLILKRGIPKEAILHEPNSTNTKEQAKGVIRLANLRNWKKIILVGSSYHQYRAYLTFLHEIFITSSEIILYNAPVNNLLWFKENTWGKRIDLLSQEFDRIEKYSNLNHLASLKQAIEYQEWKEKQQ